MQNLRRTASTRLSPCSRRPWALLLLAVGLALPLGGCGGLREILGTEGKYNFVGLDAVAAPGQEVRLGARLQKGSYFDDVEDETVRFYRGERFVAEAKTDGEGVATIAYKSDWADNYLFTARCEVHGKPKYRIETQALLAVRPAYVPLLVVDIDKTVVASDAKAVLQGKPQPMEHAQEVLKGLFTQHFLIYLTARPVYLGPKTRQWLDEYNFPLGPIFFADVEKLISGTRNYKTEVLAGIRRTFTGPGFGVGNTLADMEAYQANDLKAIYLVFLSPQDLKDKDHLEEEIEKINKLPKDVLVAWDWKEVRETIVFQKDLPREPVVRRLQEMALKLK